MGLDRHTLVLRRPDHRPLRTEGRIDGTRRRTPQDAQLVAERREDGREPRAICVEAEFLRGSDHVPLLTMARGRWQASTRGFCDDSHIGLKAQIPKRRDLCRGYSQSARCASIATRSCDDGLMMNGHRVESAAEA